MAITIPIVTSYDGRGLARATREIQEAEGGWAKTRSALQSLNGPAMAVGGAIAAGMGVAIKAASDLEQSAGAIESVFKGASAGARAALEEFGKSAADQIGISNRAFNELGAVTGASLQGLGFSADEAAQKTMDLASRASDMAAVFGGSTSDALDAVNAALRGEMDPLEKYGVKLSAASIQAEAMAETGKKTASSLTDQEKTQAALNLVMDKTANTAGQWAAQQGTVAESSQTLQAKLEDTAASLGQQLLPYAQQFLEFLSGAVDWIGQNTDIIGPLVAVVGGLAAAIVGINAAMAAYEAVTGLVAAANAIMGTSFTVALGPLGLIVAAIAAAIAAGVAIYKNWDTISAFAKQIWNAIKDFLKGVWDGIVNTAKTVWNTLKEWWTTYWNNVKAGWNTIWNAIKSFVTGLWNGIVNAAKAIWNGLKAYFTFVFNAYKTVFLTVWNAIKTAVTAIWNGLKSAATSVFNGIKSVITGVWNAIRSAASAAWNGIVGIVRGAINAIRGVIMGIKGVIDTVVGWFRSMGSGISNALSSVGGLFKSGGATIGFDDAPQLRAAGLWRAGAAGGSYTTINVTGAVDPESTARQIRALLDGHIARQGGQVQRAMSW